jgi:hypothetical protein
MTLSERTATGLVSIGRVHGVPLFYERLATGPRPQTFRVAGSFVSLLEAIVRDLKQRAPEEFGTLERITSGGMHVDKPGPHGAGQACDLDRVTYSRIDIAPIERAHLSPSKAVRRRYWAVVAICRAHASPVLHGLYDDGPHDDHAHIQTTESPAFNSRRSTTQICQALANEVYGHTLDTDGVYGPRTAAALADIGAAMGLPVHPVETPQAFRTFLLKGAKTGFRRSLG